MTTTLERPADLLDSFYSNLAAQQQERGIALRDLAKLRKEARAEIERLIGFLDESDEYVMTEFEEAVDDEACDEDELDVLLGSADNMMNQEQGWRAKGGQSGDLESDGDCDAEPLIGTPDSMLNQVHAWGKEGGLNGEERDDADSEIGDDERDWRGQ